MNRFSFSDCKIFWVKKTRTPKRDKVAIKTDLKTMSNIVEEAMTYTKGKISKENRQTVVHFWLHTGVLEECYYLKIYYELDMKAWSFGIFTGNDELTAEIISEKCPCLQIVLDEDAEEENL